MVPAVAVRNLVESTKTRCRLAYGEARSTNKRAAVNTAQGSRCAGANIPPELSNLLRACCTATRRRPRGGGNLARLVFKDEAERASKREKRHVPSFPSYNSIVRRQNSVGFSNTCLRTAHELPLRYVSPPPFSSVDVKGKPHQRDHRWISRRALSACSHRFFGRGARLA